MNFLLIDCPNLCHRSYHTTGTLDQGTLFGFLRELDYLRQHYRDYRFLFFWDSRHTIRKDMFAGYKISRTEKWRKLTDEEKASYEDMRTQMDLLRREILWDLGYNNVRWQKGFEADDLVAAYTQQARDSKLTSDLIVSGDHDYYQCLSNRVSMLKPKGHVLYTAKDFVREYAIEPERWHCVKALAGCDSDDVPGVKGVGIATAIMYLTGTLNPAWETAKRIEASKDVFNRNLKLVKLPLPGVKPFALKDDDASHAKWKSVVKNLGIKSLLGTFA
jgi:DNA polymerase I